MSDDLGGTTIDISTLANKDYPTLAREVMGALLPDYSADEIAACVDEAYTGTFASSEVTPLVPLSQAPDADGTPAYAMESSCAAPRARSRTSRCRCFPPYGAHRRSRR